MDHQSLVGANASSIDARGLIERAVAHKSLPGLMSALETIRSSSHNKEILSNLLVAALRHSIDYGTTDMVVYLVDIEHIPVPPNLEHSTVAHNISVALLEALVSRGYDFDREGAQNLFEEGRNLIDCPCVLRNEEVVRWLVDHGARLDRGQEDYLIAPMPGPLLENAAMYASVATFKLLHEKGAKLGRRTLHLAVLFAASVKADPTLPATSPAYDPSKESAGTRKRFAEMLPYLVDELRLDVNEQDLDEDRRLRWLAEQGLPFDPEDVDPMCYPTGHYGSPLCYAVYNRGIGIVKWLLSKGADPMRGGHHSMDATLMAKSVGSDPILKLFQEWEEKKSHESVQVGMPPTSATSPPQ